MLNSFVTKIMEFVLKTIHASCVGSRVRKHNIDKNKLLFKLLGISHTKKTYSTGWRKNYLLMELKYFSANNEKII
jgi:hypothetical protein